MDSPPIKKRKGGVGRTIHKTHLEFARTVPHNWAEMIPEEKLASTVMRAKAAGVLSFLRAGFDRAEMKEQMSLPNGSSIVIQKTFAVLIANYREAVRELIRASKKDGNRLSLVKTLAGAEQEDYLTLAQQAELSDWALSQLMVRESSFTFFCGGSTAAGTDQSNGILRERVCQGFDPDTTAGLRGMVNSYLLCPKETFRRDALGTLAAALGPQISQLPPREQ